MANNVLHVFKTAGANSLEHKYHYRISGIEKLKEREGEEDLRYFAERLKSPDNDHGCKSIDFSPEHDAQIIDGKWERCFPLDINEERNFWNVLNADSFDIRLGADNSGLFECNPLPLELTGKENPIKCVYKTPIKGEQAYTTTLLVDLKYGYSHSTSAKTTIFKRV